MAQLGWPLHGMEDITKDPTVTGKLTQAYNSLDEIDPCTQHKVNARVNNRGWNVSGGSLGRFASWKNSNCDSGRPIFQIGNGRFVFLSSYVRK